MRLIVKARTCHRVLRCSGPDGVQTLLSLCRTSGWTPANRFSCKSLCTPADKPRSCEYAGGHLGTGHQRHRDGGDQPAPVDGALQTYAALSAQHPGAAHMQCNFATLTATMHSHNCAFLSLVKTGCLNSTHGCTRFSGVEATSCPHAGVCDENHSA